jgi:hypothetical protein
MLPIGSGPLVVIIFHCLLYGHRALVRYKELFLPRTGPQQFAPLFGHLVRQLEVLQRTAGVVWVSISVSNPIDSTIAQQA